MCSGIDLVNKIDDILNELGESRKEFAKQLDLNPSTIATWKTKNILPPVETLYKIASKLEVSLEWLVTEISISNVDSFHRTVGLRRKIRKRIYDCIATKANVKNADTEEFHRLFFANHQNLTYRILFNWAEGRKNLSECDLKDIAFSLGISMDYLFLGEKKDDNTVEKKDLDILDTAKRNLNDLFCLDNLTEERRKLAKDMLNQLMELENLKYIERTKENSN